MSSEMSPAWGAQLIAALLYAIAAIGMGALLVIGAVAAAIVVGMHGTLAIAGAIDAALVDEARAAIDQIDGLWRIIAATNIVGGTFIAWFLYRVGSDELRRWFASEAAPEPEAAQGDQRLNIAPDGAPGRRSP